MKRRERAGSAGASGGDAAGGRVPGREIGVDDSQHWAVRGGRGDVSGRYDKIRI